MVRCHKVSYFLHEQSTYDIVKDPNLSHRAQAFYHYTTQSIMSQLEGYMWLKAKNKPYCLLKKSSLYGFSSLSYIVLCLSTATHLLVDSPVTSGNISSLHAFCCQQPSSTELRDRASQQPSPITTQCDRPAFCVDVHVTVWTVVRVCVSTFAKQIKVLFGYSWIHINLYVLGWGSSGT